MQPLNSHPLSNTSNNPISRFTNYIQNVSINWMRFASLTPARIRRYPSSVPVMVSSAVTSGQVCLDFTGSFWKWCKSIQQDRKKHVNYCNVSEGEVAYCTWTNICSLSMRIPPRARRSSPERISIVLLDSMPTTILLEPSTSRTTKGSWLLTSSFVAPGAQCTLFELSGYYAKWLVSRALLFKRYRGSCTHHVPFPVVELWASGHADQALSSADLHQRDAVFQGQNKPVLPVFGVSVENGPLWVKCP